MSPNVLHFPMLTAAGWLNRHQQAALAYLQAENAVLREQLASVGHRPRLTDKRRGGLPAPQRAFLGGYFVGWAQSSHPIPSFDGTGGSSRRSTMAVNVVDILADHQSLMRWKT